MSQALSLRCGICGVQLRSVAEAQTHGEMTGHSNFEESTEPVLNLKCQECGKPCRSQTEQDLHTKRTGHNSFVDKTIEEATAMDTEGQMKELSEETRAEAGLPSAEEERAADDQPKSDIVMVVPEVDEALKAQLQDMGFSSNKALRALHFTGTANLEQAVNWLVDHGEDADIDAPLLIPKAEQKPVLTAEEKRIQAEELLRKAKEKRLKEEAEMEKLREKERIRAGKELQAARRLEEEQALKRNAAARELEKKEAAMAREKIRLKLAEDKRERRRKLGLPEEPTPEELAREAEAEAKKAAAAKEAAQARQPVKPTGVSDKLRAALVEMKKSCSGDAEKPKVAWATMMKYVGNVAKNPGEEKFRRIKLANAAFQSRVASLPGSITFLELVGFQKDDSGEALYMPANKVNVELLNLAAAELHNASTNPFFGAL